MDYLSSGKSFNPLNPKEPKQPELVVLESFTKPSRCCLIGHFSRVVGTHWKWDNLTKTSKQSIDLNIFLNLGSDINNSVNPLHTEGSFDIFIVVFSLANNPNHSLCQWFLNLLPNPVE
jgi:hypothetical protein